MAKELQMRLNNVEILSREVSSQEQAQQVIDAFLEDSCATGDLDFYYVELDKDCNEVVCRKLY